MTQAIAFEDTRAHYNDDKDELPCKRKILFDLLKWREYAYHGVWVSERVSKRTQNSQLPHNTAVDFTTAPRLA